MKWDITKYFENKYTIEMEQKKIKTLNKNRIFSNWKRILNFTFILNIGIWLVLSMQPINPIILGMGLILNNVNMQLIPIALYYLTHKLTSLVGGFGINRLYNMLFPKRKLRKISKAETEIQLAKENILHSVELEKLITRDEIYSNVIYGLYNNHVITDIGVVLANPIDDKIEEQSEELDYLITKKVLVEKYLEIYDLYYHDKLKKKFRLLSAVNNGFLYSFLTIILNQNIFNTFFNLLVTTFIFDSNIEKLLLERIDDLREESLAQALEDLKDKLGEFYIPQDPRLLIKEYTSLFEKIFELKKQIFNSYYQHYETIFRPNDGDTSETKKNSPSRSIPPIKRDYDLTTTPTHNHTKALRRP